MDDEEENGFLKAFKVFLPLTILPLLLVFSGSEFTDFQCSIRVYGRLCSYIPLYLDCGWLSKFLRMCTSMSNYLLLAKFGGSMHFKPVRFDAYRQSLESVLTVSFRLKVKANSMEISDDDLS